MKNCKREKKILTEVLCQYMYKTFTDDLNVEKKIRQAHQVAQKSDQLMPVSQIVMIEQSSFLSCGYVK